MLHRVLSRVSPFSAQSSSLRVFVRRLNLHEHDSKALLRKYDVNVQRSAVASTPEAAKDAAISVSMACCVITIITELAQMRMNML